MAIPLLPTLGAVYIGSFFSAILYGATSLQAFIYLAKFWKTDKLWMKLLVIVIWMLETIHMCFVFGFTFRTMIIDFGNFVQIGVTKNYENVTTAITGLIILLTHWYAGLARDYLKDTSDILKLLRSSLMDLIQVQAFAKFHNTTPYYTSALSIAAANDILIALALSYYLLLRRSGMRRTDHIIIRIITFTVSSGILTSVTDVVILACFVAMPNNLVYLAFFQFVNNFYANALLATRNWMSSLNARGFPANDSSMYDATTDHGTRDVIAFAHLPRSTTSTQVHTRDTAMKRHNAEVCLQADTASASVLEHEPK
ncbi:hypothetical protein EIP91_007968 [Steccherinum ochraceum]|uniref:DUF6534 domain-containing protein n=1 Tax=Steccherinum ochraceum TaxID=92696 RepID=A0A4R0R5W7_9APHY|nr:hypothetical protein EIP91_007968 [Steccherinum ochraceum]